MLAAIPETARRDGPVLVLAGQISTTNSSRRYLSHNLLPVEALCWYEGLLSPAIAPDGRDSAFTPINFLMASLNHGRDARVEEGSPPV